MQGPFAFRRVAAWGMALGLWLALAPLPIAAAEERFPPPSGTLRIAETPPFAPGQVVHLSWDPFPVEVEEFEILLEAEFPAPLRVRLTESEDASRRGLAVALPALAPCTARFLLRAGAPQGEFLFGLSEPWRLEAPLQRSVQRLEERKGELWLSPLDFRDAGLAPGTPPLVDHAALPPATVPTAPWRVFPSEAPVALARGRTPIRPSARWSPAFSAHRASYPLRI